MRLNLIGNGFDLYHGLPSSYYYFGCFLIDSDFEFYREMANMFGFIYGRSEGFPSDEIIPTVDNMWWRDFENMLGQIEPTWIEETLMDDLGLEYPDDPVDLNIPEVEMAQKIVCKFIEWISNTVNTEKNYKIIKNMIGADKCEIRRDDYFINFNYTPTLERIYKVTKDRILYIHGKCGEDELIVGHGNNRAIVEVKNKISEIESERYYLQCQADRNRLNEYKAELETLQRLKKDVACLIDVMSSDLSRSHVIPDEILIWGLSCGEVDLPYIKELKDRFPHARWSFSYYDLNEKNKREELSKDLGIINPKFFSLNNSNADDIRRVLVETNKIVECESR